MAATCGSCNDRHHSGWGLPAGHARRAGAIRNVAALLEQAGDTHAEQRAAQILDAVDAAGWHPARDLTHLPAQPPRPASTEAGRAAARALYETTRNRDKEPTT